MHCGTHCCGCGACNIFCCNCDNGCKLKWTRFWRRQCGYDEPDTCWHKKKREIQEATIRNDSLEAKMLFGSIDIDGNNAITNDEAATYFESNPKFERSTSFSLDHELRKMDTNNDGMISPNEFDESL